MFYHHIIDKICVKGTKTAKWWKYGDQNCKMIKIWGPKLQVCVFVCFYYWSHDKWGEKVEISIL
jgi:hypothetical protein